MSAGLTAAAAPWVYQPPEHPPGHPEQCYYRTEHASAHTMVRSKHPGWANVMLWRFADWQHAQVELDTYEARMLVNLDAKALLALRNAINDALQDIAALPPEMPAEDSRSEYLA